MSVVNRITVSHIKKVCSSFFRNETIKPLGRWSVNENKNHNLFIDYANEDHCGICQDYLNNKIEQKKTITEIEKNLAIEYASMVVNTPN
jgi:hypothetical protein